MLHHQRNLISGKSRGSKITSTTFGTKPVQKEASIFEVITLVILHVFKRSLFVNIRYRICTYFALLFFLSLIIEFAPNVPKFYLSQSRNILNLYFVKIAWFWNLMLLIPFVILTSLLISNDYNWCVKNRVILNHLSRLAIATFFWYFWTTVFVFYKNYFGTCLNQKTYKSKLSCTLSGNYWSTVDISGHAFILIYGSLVLIEEANVFNGWESIGIFILNEKHSRKHNESLTSSNPLRHLSNSDLERFENNYIKYKPLIRILFVLIAILQILWDFMLLMTILYYHRMIEKLVAGLIAIFTWFISYKLWFTFDFLLPNLPGSDIIKYRSNFN